MTHVNADMFNVALKAFDSKNGLAAGETLGIMEMSIHSLRSGGEIDLQDFLARAEVLSAAGYTVLITDYFEHYRLAAYLWRYTTRPIGIAMGAGSLQDLFDEKHYRGLEGGILESLGRLFKNELKLYIYPLRDPDTGTLHTVENIKIAEGLTKLYGHLVEHNHILPLEGYREEVLHIFSPDVLAKIQSGDQSWQAMVPEVVASVIKSRALFGYRSY